ncbi:hypothetical protein [Halomonas salifodinae]|uniref:hypothetical protein n=1 Tax=Halomonas salifodinae TaxID=438745 RepID=UPI0033B00D07
MRYFSTLPIMLLLSLLMLTGCSTEGRESGRMYNALLKDVEAIEALGADASIGDRLAAYSRARHRIEELRTRYASTRRGEEVLGNPALSSSHSVEDILYEATSLEKQAYDELSENQIEFIILNTLPTPELRNDRLESHGLSLVRQGALEEAEAVIPHLLNSLSTAIVQLEIAKEYQHQGNIEAAREFSLEAYDNISRYNFNEAVCSTASCEGEETRKMLVDTELRRVRIALYAH